MASGQAPVLGVGAGASSASDCVRLTFISRLSSFWQRSYLASVFCRSSLARFRSRAERASITTTRMRGGSAYDFAPHCRPSFVLDRVHCILYGLSGVAKVLPHACDSCSVKLPLSHDICVTTNVTAPATVWMVPASTSSASAAPTAIPAITHYSFVDFC